MCIKGCPVKIYQDVWELNELRKIVQRLQPCRILEIGSMFGGTLWFWLQDHPGARVVSVDMPVGPADSRHNEVMACRNLWTVWAEATGSELVPMISDSTQPETVETVRRYGPFDFVFIDGGHDYQTAMSDIRNYWPMVRPGGMLAMHDICYPDGSIFDTARVWREVRPWAYRTQEIIREHNPENIWGIGVMLK